MVKGYYPVFKTSIECNFNDDKHKEETEQHKIKMVTPGDGDGYSIEEPLVLLCKFSKFYDFYSSNIKYADKTLTYGNDDNSPSYIDRRDNDDVVYDTQHEYSTSVAGDKILDIIETHLTDSTIKDKSCYIHVPFQGFNADSVNSNNSEVVTNT